MRGLFIVNTYLVRLLVCHLEIHNSELHVFQNSLVQIYHRNTCGRPR